MRKFFESVKEVFQYVGIILIACLSAIILWIKKTEKKNKSDL